MNDEPGDDHRLCRFGGVFSSAPMRQVFSDENRIAHYLAVVAFALEANPADYDPTAEALTLDVTVAPAA
jgi:hypothetical protein